MKKLVSLALALAIMGTPVFVGAVAGPNFDISPTFRKLEKFNSIAKKAHDAAMAAIQNIR